MNKQESEPKKTNRKKIVFSSVIVLFLFMIFISQLKNYTNQVETKPVQVINVQDQRVGIVIPTYNEADNLQPLLSALRTVLPTAMIVIVDDASPDGTGQLADHKAAKDRFIKVCHRPGKLGLGTAYITGFLEALSLGCDIIVQMDADYSHDPSAVPFLIAELAYADLVLGSRYVPGGSTVDWNLFRMCMSRCASLYACNVLGLPYRDLTGGFKAWRATALKRVLEEEIYSLGYSFQIETTYRAHKIGLFIREIPICFRDRQRGHSKIDFSIVLEALRVCWKLCHS